MNQNLQKILLFLQQDKSLSAEENASLIKAVVDSNKELEITAFKLDRTEKVKRTTAILLEETIEELEQKRKAVEAQNRELEIETSLERVRTVAMGMQNPAEMVDVCKIISEQLEFLKVKDIRNVQTAVIYESKGTYINYEYYARHNKLLATEVSYKTHHLQEQFANQMLKGAGEFFSASLEGQEVKDWYEYQKTTNQFADSFLEEAETLNYYMFSLGSVALGISTYSPLIEEEVNLFKRFRNVFELAYRRFLDIQKAEAQAREAQIEAALERVRSRSMGMYKSEELIEVVRLLDKEIKGLGVQVSGSQIVTNFANLEEGQDDWFAREGQDYLEKFHIPYLEHPLTKRIYNALLKGVDFYTENYSKAEKNKYFRLLFKYSDFRKITKERQEFINHSPAWIRAVVVSKNSILVFQRFELKDFTKEEEGIFKRFGKVFEQAYTRFLDLQKAEVQAREAQIEAALERVRSKTMAMHNSQDVGDTVATMFEELVKLDIKTNRCGILIFGNTLVTEVWTAKSNPDGKAILIIGQLDLSVHPLLTGFYQSWKNKDPFFTYPMLGDDLVAYYKAINETKYYPTHFNLEDLPSREFHSDFYFAEGAIFAFTPEPIPDEATLIFKRFAGVFGQTYRRYLDLQKAETQAREATIEAALEKIRSRSLAMFQSNELKDVIAIMAQKLKELGVLLGTVAIQLFDQKNKNSFLWAGNEFHDEPPLVNLPYNEKIFNEDTFLKDSWQARIADVSIINKEYSIEQKDKYFTYVFAHNDLTVIPLQVRNFIMQAQSHIVCLIVEKISALFVDSWNGQFYNEEMLNVLKRAAKVFEQAYVRFLDLQKAEAQAQEATIEAALEKVRGRAMAMHNSNDVSVTASLVFTELRKLGINPVRCGVGLLVNGNPKAQLYSATSSADGDSLSLVGWVELSGHPVLQGIYDNWLKQEDYFPELTGEQLKLYYEKLLSGLSLPSVPDWTKGEKQYGHFLTFSVASLYAWSDTPYDESEIKILKRFASVIDLTFRRYIELQKSEAQAKEAIKASSLDRVRAEIASMRSVDDLQRITPIIWHELIALGVPFVRCGVFIINESTAHIQVFLSSPEGKSLAAMDLPFDSGELTINLVNHWRKGLIFKTHWNKQEFLSFMQTMIKEGQVENQETYQGASAPPESLDLHFVPFAQGMLYVGNILRLTNDELDLVKSLAEAFSIAYARYEDFKALEIAKQSIETTLSELKAAQSQLVQSEKMASLGELTAGIAHEIQNPLNFVNNFSEVNTELIQEMKDEIDKGNLEEVKALANDISENEQKIIHHGKRADAIVKGMLQHSRSSTGTKEPTDINALADEYLRLAYHGLRAKDKSFNATMKTDFDESIGNINIIPQDIGRVILNLITNAFYAVNEKKYQAPPPPEGGIYEPIVTVRTSLNPPSGGRGAEVLISVRDNGNGIPQHILEKIFQPFFTTKPTGEGTGLGLSMSYDIVKAHGGELKVETMERQGSEFKIVLPN